MATATQEVTRVLIADDVPDVTAPADTDTVRIELDGVTLEMSEQTFADLAETGLYAIHKRFLETWTDES